MTPDHESDIHEFSATVIGGRGHSWAGEGPSPDQFALGTFDGRLVYAGLDSHLGSPRKVVRSSESINGLAFTREDGNRLIGVSTRAEVVVHRFRGESDYLGSVRHDGGSHGIYPTAWGGFLSPLGRDGVLSISHAQENRFRVAGVSYNNPEAYFYKLTSVGVLDGRELWACAGRREGLFVIEVGPDGQPRMIKRRKPIGRDVDVVSVCSIGDEDFPHAVAGVSRDRTIHLSYHLLDDRQLVSLSLPDLQGTAYKIQAHGNDVIIHTSKGIYVCRDVLHRFTRNIQTNEPTYIRFLPASAIDFNLAYQKWLTLVTPEHVLRMQLSDLLNREIEEGGAKDFVSQTSSAISEEITSSGASLESQPYSGSYEDASVDSAYELEYA